MAIEAFQPQGNTQLIQVTTTPSTAIQLGVAQSGVRIVTEGGAKVHFAFSSSAGSSALQAALPTTSTPANGNPLLPNTDATFNIGPNAWLSFISSSPGPTPVEVTAGFGL